MSTTVSPTTDPTRPRLPGRTATAAIGAALLFGAAAALGLALPKDAATQPVEPTSQCVITSCHAGQHPVLPGRHDFQIRPHGNEGPTRSGGQPQVGLP